jgi:voltage-gated potassium channel
VFCFLPDDAENVFLTISARSLDASLQIIALTQSTEAAGKLLAAGADKVIDPYEISGARIFEILERPEVVEVLENTVFGRQDLNIAELTVPAGAWTDQCPLSALRHAIKQNVILLGVVDRERGSELIYSMRGVDHKLDAGDVLVVLGSRRQIESLRELIGRVAVPDGAGI